MGTNYQSYAKFKADIWSAERRITPQDPRIKAFRKFVRFCRRPVSVVDVGCGDGAFLRTISTHPTVSRCIGIDLSWNNQPSSQVEYYNGDIFEILQKLQIEGDILFTCFDFLEHLSYDDILRLTNMIGDMSEGRDVYLVIRSPNTVSPFSLYGQEGDITHLSRLCIMRVEQLLVASGVNFARLFYGGSRYFSWKSMGRLPFAIFATLSMLLYRGVMLGLGCRDEAGYYPAFVMCLHLRGRSHG